MTCSARVAVVLAACFAVSCGGDATPESEGTGTIRFWHFWSEPGQRAALKERVAAFEQRHNCTVELTELSWNDGKAKLQAAFSSGNAPDVIELGSDWIAQFSSAGVLAELPADSNAIGRFVPWSMVPGRWEGHTYAYPWTVDTRVLYVNTSMMAAAGVAPESVTSLDAMQMAAERIHAKGGTGYGANGADANRLYKKILPFIWSMGGDIFDADGKPTFNAPANVQALQRYADLAATGYVETQRQLDAAFIQGKVGLWNSGSWILKRLRAAGTPFAIVPMPGRTAGEAGISFAGGEYLAVSKTSKRATLARMFLREMTSAAEAVAFCKAVPEAGFPADRHAYQDTSLTADPDRAAFARQLAAARMTPVHPRWLDIQTVLEDAVVKVLYGTHSPQQALDIAQQQVLDIVNG